MARVIQLSRDIVELLLQFPHPGVGVEVVPGLLSVDLAQLRDALPGQRLLLGLDSARALRCGDEVTDKGLCAAQGLAHSVLLLLEGLPEHNSTKLLRLRLAAQLRVLLLALKKLRTNFCTPPLSRSCTSGMPGTVLLQTLDLPPVLLVRCGVQAALFWVPRNFPVRWDSQDAAHSQACNTPLPCATTSVPQVSQFFGLQHKAFIRGPGGPERSTQPNVERLQRCSRGPRNFLTHFAVGSSLSMFRCGRLPRIFASTARLAVGPVDRSLVDHPCPSRQRRGGAAHGGCERVRGAGRLPSGCPHCASDARV
mmetsp:Transcript_14102/g.30897  ORF Transcript_14102/g.30897 Transcript_14102/m.30897 type:complete len:309 (+) Transcript_14102:97-1023(+)